MFIKQFIFLWFLLCVSFVKRTLSANILVADCMPSPSHQIWNYALAEGLLAKGHNITMLGPRSVRSIVNKNFHFLSLGNLHEIVMQDFKQEEIVSGRIFDMMMFYYDYSINACKYSLQSDGFKTLMDYPKVFKFDAILFDLTLSNCFLPLIQKFNYPPAVGITAFLLPPFLSFPFGNDLQPSYLPSFYTAYSSNMNFFERLHNYFCVYGDTILRTVYMDPQVVKLAKEVFGDDMDAFSDLENHVSLLLSSVDPVLHIPQPLTPNIIPVGGLHVKPKKLPQDLQQIMDTAPHGVILFSLGTNVKSVDLTPYKREAIIQVFSNLKQTVLWKFESNITGLSNNVIVRNWLPQSDILAHPNLRLFITHCGALSTAEATYFGVPVLGMPFIIDQHLIIQNLINKKVAKKIDYVTLTAENLLANINDMLYNPQYSKRMQELSRRMRDQPQTPLERAVFWIEYAIRHNGTHFLNPKSRNLSLFITSCTDIHLFLLVTFCFLLYVIKQVSKCIRKEKNKTKQE